MEVCNLSDPDAVLDWTKGLINLQGLSFVELMEKYAKAFNVDIVMERKDIPEIACTRGKIRVSDGIDHALEVLRMAADFRYVRDYQSNVIYIH